MVLSLPMELTAASNGTDQGAGGSPKKIPTQRESNFSMADSVAAVTIAVLACTILITVICIVRLLRKRRTQQQGRQLSQMPAMYASTIGANVMAFHNLHQRTENDPDPSWEPVQVQQETAANTPSTAPSGDVSPSTSASYYNSDEVPVVSIISIHNSIQRQQNHINAAYLADSTDEAVT